MPAQPALATNAAGSSSTSSTAHLLSPAELSYLHTSLSLSPPVRPDLRSATQFRPLVAESDVLPGTHGSGRVCFADGSEAVVGVKLELEKHSEVVEEGKGRAEWVELFIDVPGLRDDDSLPVFLATMLREALAASGLPAKLAINARFHWKVFVDVLLLSPPLSYPLPLLSLTIYLALLSARLPRLKSEKDEDPLFDDDWDASLYLYPKNSMQRPPITLLVMTVASNIIFDPSGNELAVAESVLAVSVSASSKNVLAIRTIDPPSKLTPPGVPDRLNVTAAAGQEAAKMSAQQATTEREAMSGQGVWTPPRGGIKWRLISDVLKKILMRKGVVDEIVQALEGLDYEER